MREFETVIRYTTFAPARSFRLTWKGHHGFVRDVSITTDSIRLGQFLKLADAVDVGSDVKDLLASGAVRVNAEPETRRGRQLVRGDIITVEDVELRVS